MSRRRGTGIKRTRLKDGNGLLSPTAAERQAGLPTSYADAIAKGFNEFEENGEVKKIRFKNRRQPDKHGMRAEVENAASWRSRNKHQKELRPAREKLLTPNAAERAAATAEMSDLTSKGKVGHHGMPIAEAERGYRHIAKTKGKAAADKWVRTQKNIGKPVGHVKPNIFGMTIPDHKQLHNVAEKHLKNAIRNAGSAADAVFKPLQKLGNRQSIRPSRGGSTGSGVSTTPASSLTMGSKPSLGKVVKTLYGGKAVMHDSPFGIPIYVP